MTDSKDSDNNFTAAPYPEIRTDECKSCGRCVRACPRQLLEIGLETNTRGYRFAVYKGSNCSGCAICYYACPEPHAIRIHRKVGTTVPDKKSEGGEK